MSSVVTVMVAVLLLFFISIVTLAIHPLLTLLILVSMLGFAIHVYGDDSETGQIPK